jgi:hypothetical protein
MFAAFTLLLAGCSSPPVFDGIDSVTVIVQTEMGTSKVELKGDQLDKARSCLYGTEEIQQEEAKTELLQEILMLEVRDRSSDRTFELYTDENFHGSKKLYRNTCIYRQMHEAMDEAAATP